MEKNIYDRQINKQGISDRVVDELNPQNLLSRKQVDILMRYEVWNFVIDDVHALLSVICANTGPIGFLPGDGMSDNWSEQLTHCLCSMVKVRFEPTTL